MWAEFCLCLMIIISEVKEKSVILFYLLSSWAVALSCCPTFPSSSSTSSSSSSSSSSSPPRCSVCGHVRLVAEFIYLILNQPSNALIGPVPLLGNEGK